ncbi:phage tail assembly protein [Chromobacterium phragmitis]|uniref:phage tail assembly protein n=1 Tax=Chromobacterium phragmitis TaxID=2202141 RepID=UPI00143CE1A9
MAWTRASRHRQEDAGQEGFLFARMAGLTLEDIGQLDIADSKALSDCFAQWWAPGSRLPPLDEVQLIALRMQPAEIDGMEMADYWCWGGERELKSRSASRGGTQPARPPPTSQPHRMCRSPPAAAARSSRSWRTVFWPVSTHSPPSPPIARTRWKPCRADARRGLIRPDR